LLSGAVISSPGITITVLPTARIGSAPDKTKLGCFPVNMKPVASIRLQLTHSGFFTDQKNLQLVGNHFLPFP